MCVLFPHHPQWQPFEKSAFMTSYHGEVDEILQYFSLLRIGKVYHMSDPTVMILVINIDFFLMVTIMLLLVQYLYCSYTERPQSSWSPTVLGAMQK